jgi:hypothetical protein
MTPLQRDFHRLLEQELSRFSIFLRSAEFLPATRKDQVHNVGEKWTLHFSLQGVPNIEWFMEVHSGEYKGSPQHYVNVSNDSEWTFFAGLFGDAQGQLESLASRAVKGFVNLYLVPCSIAGEALKGITACWLPVGFKARLTEDGLSDFEVYDFKSGDIVARYMFRDFVLYRSHYDDIFSEERKWFLKKLETHSLGEYAWQDITPRHWVELIRAWISRDFFYTFGHLVESDIQFKVWGKELVKLPSEFPWRFRTDWETGLTRWVTKSEVKQRTSNRAKWSPTEVSSGN